MKDDTAGDPMGGVNWSRRATTKISHQLEGCGIKVGERTVARLLKSMGYSLRKNVKSIESGGNTKVKPALRNKQFLRIARQRKQFAKYGNPCVSVDTKKKELIGNFKNDGVRWDDNPTEVFDHDFPSDAEGKAVPYGIYDTETNEGTVFLGNSHDTPSFAVECVEKWWCKQGRIKYPNSNEILILADCGGSNSYRARMWKYKIKELLCDKHQLTVKVCHFPPGASKWNPIEHKLFSQISINWAGVPIKSFEVALKYIRSTTTKTGMKVKAFLVNKFYPKGETVSDNEFNKIKEENIIFSKRINPSWNYTVVPSKN